MKIKLNEKENRLTTCDGRKLGLTTGARLGSRLGVELDVTEGLSDGCMEIEGSEVGFSGPIRNGIMKPV